VAAHRREGGGLPAVEPLHLRGEQPAPVRGPRRDGGGAQGERVLRQLDEYHVGQRRAVQELRGRGRRRRQEQEAGQQRGAEERCPEA